MMFARLRRPDDQLGAQGRGDIADLVEDNIVVDISRTWRTSNNWSSTHGSLVRPRLLKKLCLPFGLQWERKRNLAAVTPLGDMSGIEIGP
jgi:hypothetical protein